MEQNIDLLNQTLNRRRRRPRRQLVDSSVPSPCIMVCRLEDGACVGCGRTGEEIRNWIIMTASEKHEVLALADQRLNAQNCAKSAVG